MSTAIYLFDWGNTLMIDFPNYDGKMRDWPKVAMVDGAEDLLRRLSRHSQCYVATAAADSSEADIKAAFTRVGLDCYIIGYFCQANTGQKKGSPEFLATILLALNATPSQVSVVGDSLEKDIRPALAAGIRATWLTQETPTSQDSRIKIIRSLQQF